MTSLRQMVCPVPSSFKSSTLQSRGMKKDIESQVINTMDYCNISLDLALNILTYGKTLERCGCGSIDVNIFQAQLVRYFDITQIVMVQRMYHACKNIGETMVNRCKTHRDLTTVEFSKMIGLFLSEETEKQVEFVFSVYDVHCVGYLDKAACKALIQGEMSETHCTFGDEIDEAETATEEILEMLMNVFDINRDGNITFDEFKNIAKHNSLYTQALGRCLPEPRQIAAFLEVLKGKTTIEIAAFFRNERKLALNKEQSKDMPPMYPVDLEMPVDLF